VDRRAGLAVAENIVGIAIEVAGEPAEGGAAGVVVPGFHPVRQRAGTGELDLAVDALLAEVAIAIGGDLLAVEVGNVEVHGEGILPLGSRREPVLGITRPFVRRALGLVAVVAIGLGLGLGDLDLGLELADPQFRVMELLVAAADVDVGVLHLGSADDIGGAKSDLQVFSLELIAKVEAALLAGFEQDTAVELAPAAVELSGILVDESFELGDFHRQFAGDHG